MAADFVRANCARLDDLMGDDSALFRDVMRGPAQRQPAPLQRRGLTRPEDRLVETDADIFASTFEDKPAAAPRRTPYRSQWD